MVGGGGCFCITGRPMYSHACGLAFCSLSVLDMGPNNGHKGLPLLKSIPNSGVHHELEVKLDNTIMRKIMFINLK